MELEVVACLVSCEEDWLLLRRSEHVGSDQGLWHCVTGFCEDGVSARAQARQELAEEAGLSDEDVELREELEPLRLAGGDGRSWKVHVFHFVANCREVELNWEHDDVRWAQRSSFDQLPIVDWLPELHRHLSEQT
jgi:ADP-ribose pyrophosphatase YjhB (NUDIX family)